MAHESTRPRHLTFGHLDGAVGVAVPTVGVAQSLERLLSGLRTSPEVPVHASLRLEETAEGWMITGDESPASPFASLAAAIEALEYLVAVRLLCLVGTLPHLHAAGVVHGGRAVLALGASGTGKTTLALTWSTGRHPVLSDDVALLGRDGCLSGFRRLFTTTRAGLERAGLAPAATASDGPDVVRFDPAPHGGWAESAPPAALAWTRYEPGAHASVRHLSKPEALNRLTAALLPTGLSAPHCFDQLVQLARTAVTVELAFDDARRAADALLDLA